MKNYAPNDGDQHGYGYGFLWWESKDEAIPAKPIVRYTGPAGFPAGQLLFQVSAPAAPPKITNSVVAVQWRAAQISAPGLAGYVAGQPRRYEMEQPWTSGPLAAPAGELRLPGEVCAPQAAPIASVLAARTPADDGDTGLNQSNSWLTADSPKARSLSRTQISIAMHGE